MSSVTVTVSGMTCSHCAASVREEVAAIAGVTDVDVDADSGEVILTADHAVDTATIKAAVEEAGYRLVG